MARHGTLPKFMYERQSENSDKPVSIAFDEQVNTADAAAATPTAELDDDEADEYDESSDEEVEDRPVSQRIRTPGPNPLADMDPPRGFGPPSIRQYFPFETTSFEKKVFCLLERF